jgi:hypothetical protein
MGLTFAGLFPCSLPPYVGASFYLSTAIRTPCLRPAAQGLAGGPAESRIADTVKDAVACFAPFVAPAGREGRE